MGTWVKETDEAFYLMQGNQWISRIQKRPSTTNPKEQVLNVEGMRQWFMRSDAPMAMTVSVGAGGPEPEQKGATATPGSTAPSVEGNGQTATPSESTTSVEGNGQTATPSESTTLTEKNALVAEDTPITDAGTAPPETPPTEEAPAPPPLRQGLSIKVISTTYFKLQPKLNEHLTEAEKVLVSSGTILGIQYYVDVGNNHWRIELVEPTLGDKTTKTWFVHAPDIAVLTGVTLTTKVSTLLKAEPKSSSELTDDQKIAIEKGATYKLLSFEPAAGDHLQVELANATLGQEQSRKWYIYNPDIKIEGNRETLEVVGDTIFKLEPIQSSQLPDSDKILIKKGTVFLLHSYGQPDKNHVRVALKGAFLGPKNLTAWYAFIPDIQISGTEVSNKPDDKEPKQPANPVDRGFPLTFPGFSGTYYSNNPIQPTNRYGQRGNFTWGEALHVNRSTGRYRRPASTNVVYNIIKVADVMEEIRHMYGGQPIRINSWYRDPATNRAVGGASRSRHLSGDAVDFVVPGVSCFNVYARLNPWWGSRGGLASSSVFTHIDVRGFRARWSYGY
jgi:uncharacterized protein YcbK (DUF882 family)